MLLNRDAYKLINVRGATTSNEQKGGKPKIINITIVPRQYSKEKETKQDDMKS